MSAHAALSRQVVEAHSHNFAHVDESWLQPLGIEGNDTLALVLSNRRACRLLTLSLLDHYHLQAAPAEGLTQSHCWVLRDRKCLRTLALQLGLLANADFLRTTVSREALTTLHDTLGAVACRQAIEACAGPDHIEVFGLSSERFDSAVQCGDVESYVFWVGRKLLTLALQDAGDFARQRLRFAFRANNDDGAAPILSTDLSRLIQTIEKLAREL